MRSETEPEGASPSETGVDPAPPRWWIVLLPFAGCLAAGVLAVAVDRLI